MNANSSATGPGELRRFGLLFAALLVLLFEGLLPWLRHHPVAWWPVCIAAPVAALALVWPAALRPLYAGWMKFGAVMAFINTRVIMSLLFFAVLTPLGWLQRRRGRDSMARGFDRAAASYRIAAARDDKTDLEKPY